MVVYDLKKDEIPDIVDKLMECTTAVNSEQKRIAGDIVKEISLKHRTVQQLLIKLFSEVLNEYSNARCDPRNYASVEYCKKVSKIDNSFPFI